MKYFYDDANSVLIGVEIDALNNPMLRFFKEVGSGDSIDDLPEEKSKKRAGGGRPRKKKPEGAKEEVKTEEYNFEKFVGKKPRKCGVCGQPGHRKEKCPNEGRVAADEAPAEPEAIEGGKPEEKPELPVPLDAQDLTEEQKAEILRKFNEGQPPSTPSNELAREYKVSIKAIWWVIRNRPKK